MFLGMIEYEQGKWHVMFIFTCRGSVFPKALVWALPCTGLGCIFHMLGSPYATTAISQVWAAYNFVLGFLIVFRTQQAYSRFWEGATILLQVRGEWINAVSSSFAFCSMQPSLRTEVDRFQHLLVRLMSLMHCAALQQVCILSDEAFEVFDLDGVDKESLQYLAGQGSNKTLVILQWIQKLISMNVDNGVLSLPAPLITRIYQQLSRGIVSITDAQKITDILFPFPFAQMVTIMLIVFSVVTPIVNSSVIDSLAWNCILTFVSVFLFWSINYIAAEIEMPFGEDLNDLPIPDLQMGMNTALAVLLDKRSQRVPEFSLPEGRLSCEITTCPRDFLTDAQHVISMTGDGSLRRRRLQKQVENAAQRRTYAVGRAFTNFFTPATGSDGGEFADLSSVAAVLSEERMNYIDVASHGDPLQGRDPQKSVHPIHSQHASNVAQLDSAPAAQASTSTRLRPLHVRSRRVASCPPRVGAECPSGIATRVPSLQPSGVSW